MDRRIGSVVGLAGGVLAIVGLFLPWLVASVNLQPLRDALGPLAGAAEGALGGSLPSGVSLSGFDVLTGGIQGLLSLGSVPGAPAPDLGAAAGVVTLVIAVVALLLVFAILTIVFSLVNLLKGRLRGGMIGTGAVTLVISLVLFAGLQTLIRSVRGMIQQYAASLGGGAAAGIDVAGLLNRVFSFGVGPGIYLCVVGGALGVAGGVLGRKREKKAPAAPVEAPAAEAPK